MNYSFLNNVSLVDTQRKRAPKSLRPESGLTLRVYANGTVYPSHDLIDEFKLEYLNATDETPSYGIDIVDSKQWPVTAEFPRMILFGIVPKNQPKVDLFGTCRYRQDGRPRSTVSSQGPVSKELLDLVRSMGYLTEEQTYCDLIVRTEHPIKTQDGLAYIPKIVARGARKGEQTYERRENVTFYPADIGEEETKEVEQETTIVINEEQISN